MSDGGIRKATKKETFYVVGKRLDGIDEKAKVAGNIIYADDFSTAGMLHAKVFRSTKASAKIKSLDTNAARNLPGVAAVVTAEDVPNNRSVTSAVGQVADIGLVAAVHQLVLAEDRVRFYGEPIALVAAEDPDTAEAALKLIKVEYEDLPGVFDPEEAMKDDAPKLYGDSNVIAHWQLRRGDVDRGFTGADVIVENNYQTQFQEHAHMEPESGVAWLDDDGVLNLRVATQVIEHYREIARILGIPESKVRIRGTIIGGGFGGKEDLTVEPYIALLSWKTKRPVKLTYEREEMMFGRHKRHPYKMHFKHGVTKDGRLVAIEARLISDAGAYPYLSPWVLLYSTVHSTGPYYIPNVKVDAFSVLTNNIYTSAMRSFGSIQVAVAYESQMDILAEKLGMAPGELRKRNYLKRGSQTGTGQVIESEVLLPQTYEAAVKALGERSEPRAPYIKVGRGAASSWQSYGRMCYLRDTSSAWVGMEMDGSCVVRCGIPDLGGGQRESLRQIAAELTGAPLEGVHVISTDSQVTPLAGTVTATRALFMSGNAVKLAAEAIRHDLLQRASEMLGEAPEYLDMYNGDIFAIKNHEKKIPLAEVVKAIRNEGNTLEALKIFRAPSAEPVRQAVLGGQIFPDYTFGSQAVEVEVNILTGEVNVTRVAGAYDVGKAINPKRVEGQIEGGIAQGLGYALMEEFVEEKGIPKTLNLATYIIPTSKDVPDIQAIMLESHSGKGPFGAKGIGEAPIVATAPAVLNAIHDAVGVRIKKTPATSETVFYHLNECIER
jgi:CO/xanthine dehydrogenase Mo-binding subunit